jgi:XTP/dITP diphosphohydrolase
MNLERVVVASQNPDKIAEIEHVLAAAGVVGEIATGHSWPEVIEDAPTLEGNALLKARSVCAIIGLPAIADDSGLEVAALGGAPGVYTARFSGPGATYETNVAALLAALVGVEDRSARFRTVVALATPEGEEVMVSGELAGSISDAPRGDGGFGYDPIFLVDGETLSELGVDRKNEISHRARAIRALAAVLAQG